MTTDWGSPPGLAAAFARAQRGRVLSLGCHLGRRAQHRLDDAVVRTAAAKIAIERGSDLPVRGIRVFLQQRGCADQNAGDAVAALQRLLGDESGLQRMRQLGGSQSFDCSDVLVRDGPQRCIARRHSMIADHDIASAAFIGAAAEMRPRHPQRAAQNVEQRPVGIGVDLGLDAIEAKSNAHCGLSPKRLTTSAHFTMSLRRYLSNSSGVIDIGTAPWVVHSFTISGRFTAAFTAAFSLSMIGFGVPAGAINPSQMVASYPPMPASITVGTSGNTLERVLPVVASARTWPSVTLGAIAVTASIIIWTCPPITPLRASPLLR